jgi:2-keto-4-pentenoate hydratase/2-oxohepta-3-ene-1,7-dioic acid hydratase in catechol pathway
MKLATYMTALGARTGVLVNNASGVVDVNALGTALDIASSPSLRKRAASMAKTQKPAPAGRLKLAAPFAPRNIIAIGLNYADHVAESGSKIPGKPVVFAKLSNTLAAPGATISWRASVTDKMDWEAELGVVIGKKCHRASEAEALKYVCGYVCANDLSARNLQRGDDANQWIIGKSLDGACPVGPWLVTSDEIKDPQTLEIKCVINGEVMQHSNTRHMIFSVARLVSHLSQTITLMPGDLILTGTPPGVGMGRNPQVWLKNGDVVTVEIEKIGALTNKMRVIEEA